MVLSGGPGGVPTLEEHPRAPRHHTHESFEERGVHDLPAPAALALEERQRDPLGGEDAGQQVADRNARPRGAALGRPGDAHEAAHPLGDLVEGIVLHAFEGKAPFEPATLEVIERLKEVYGLDLVAADSHLLEEEGEVEGG